MTFNVDQLSVLWMAVQTAEDFETKQACQQALQYYALAMTPEILAHIAKLETALGDGWQDIASAPRDGRDVLVHTLHGLRRVAFWDEARGGLWSLWPGREPAQPTHWRPLPPPPGAKP